MSTEFYLALREKAAKLYPEPKAQEQFVEGFITKVANILHDVKYNGELPVGSGKPGEKNTLGANVMESFWSRGVAQAAGKALMGGVAAAGFAGLAGLAKVVSNHALYNNYLKALNEAVQTNRVLRGAEPSKVLNFGNTIFKFAPHVATDSNLLSSILANAIHGDGIDPMSMKMLTELESRYQQSKGESNFNPKAWG